MKVVHVPYKGTAAVIPAMLSGEVQLGFVEALKAPDVAQRLAGDGSTPVGSSPAEFNAHIRSEIAKWKKLVKEANLPLQK